VTIESPFGRHELAALQPELVRFAQSLGLQPADAQDVAADAMERGLNNLALLDGHGSPRAWLYTTTRNLAIDHVRASTRRRSGQLSEAEQQPSAGLSVEDYVHTRAEASIALEALEHVTPRHQYVIWRHLVMGVDAPTLAAELGLSGPAFRQLRQRARRAFWAEYGRRGGTASAAVLVVPGLQRLGRLRDLATPTAIAAPAVAVITAAVIGAGAVIFAPGERPPIALPDRVTVSAAPEADDRGPALGRGPSDPTSSQGSQLTDGAGQRPSSGPRGRQKILGQHRACTSSEGICLEVGTNPEARYLMVRIPGPVKRAAPVMDPGVGLEAKERMDPICNNLPDERVLYCTDAPSGPASPEPGHSYRK
jgi:RNA polymerase sigma factor (sigma-70 family)